MQAAPFQITQQVVDVLKPHQKHLDTVSGCDLNVVVPH